MPPVPCRWYESDGQPIKGGCRKHATGACSFIHPDNPAWGSKSKSSTAFNKSSRGPKRGPAVPSTASAWDSGAWDNAGTSSSGGWVAAGMSSASANDSGWGDTTTGGGWGDAGGWGTNVSPAQNAASGGWGNASPAQNAGGWGSPKQNAGGWGSPKQNAGGWGNTSPGGWGNTGTAGWGESPVETSGWGSGSWGDTTTVAETSGWGKPAPAGAGGGSDVPSRKKGALKPKSRTVDSGWPTKVTTTSAPTEPAGSGWPAKSTKPSTPAEPVIADKKSVDDAMLVDTYSVSSRRSSTKPAPDLERHQSGSGIDIDTWRADAAAKQGTAPPPLKYDDIDESSRSSYEKFVILLCRVVEAKTTLIQAEKERDHWRNSQKSSRYSRVGDAGRKRLEEKRMELETTIRTQQQIVNATINDLVNLEEISPHYKFQENTEDIERYINDVKKYLDDMHPLITDVVQSAHDVQHSTPQSQTLEDGQVSPYDELSSMQAKVSELESALEELDMAEIDQKYLPKRKYKIDEQINEQINARFEKLYQDLRTTASEESKKSLAGPISLPAIVQQSIDTITKRDEDRYKQIAEMQAANAQMELELSAAQEDMNQVRARQAELKAILEKREKERLESQLREDDFSAQVTALAQNVQTLKAQMNSDPPKTPLQLTLENMRTGLDEMTASIVKRDILPFVDKIRREHYLHLEDHRKEVLGFFWEKLARPLEIAEATCDWTQNASSPRIA
ncbi:hypothetical protein BJ138DRAFT_1123017 [Hygrophoropsis aurantiaca]|uniref:Uncharacterized protein n=1 Tax=Hygrophoropsis aurantiaca TaxID=72124 RepID=A0ACB8ANV3_9AGAM|nr:hypothetical protein BJ138DRAFT_1123017 [Hygrophoropsis aurantiaca]